MDKKELSTVRGGALGSFGSASWLNAFSRTANTLYNFGRSLGSSFKMLISGRRC